MLRRVLSKATQGVFGAAPARFFGAAGHHKPQTIALTFFHMPTARKYFVAHAEVGSTVFEVAKKYDIPIIGSCAAVGGLEKYCGEGPMCETCAVTMPLEYVKLGEQPGMWEKIAMEKMDEHRIKKKQTRLSCQVEVTKEMDGMVIAIPSYRSDETGREDAHEIHFQDPDARTLV